MSGKASMAGPEGDTAQEEILRKLEDTTAQRQINIGGGVMVNTGQEDYGTSLVSVFDGWHLYVISLSEDLLMLMYPQICQ